MANKKTNLINLPKELLTLLQKYGSQLIEDLNETVIEEAEKLKDLANENAPKSNRNTEVHLAGSFEVKTVKYPVAINCKIWSPKKYQIVHLLEFGHINWTDYSFVQPKPFLIPAYNVVQEELTKKFIERIKKGG